MSLVARPGTARDGLDSTKLVSPTDFYSVASEADLVHVWAVFLPEQHRLCRGLWDTKPFVISPIAHLMTPHLRRRWWKKLPYLMSLRPTVRNKVAHLFSAAERPGAARWLRPSSQFEASVGLFPAPLGSLGGNPARSNFILFLGRNDVYQKGIDILLRGYASGVASGLELPLVIAGRPEADSGYVIRRMISKLGLEGKVDLLGDVSETEKDQLLAGARCLTFLSRWDGPPRPVREALALGTPVIVSPGTNLGEIVTNFSAGTRVEPTPHDVGKALLKTQDDGTVRSWREGVSLLQKTLTWDFVAHQYTHGYALALESRHPSV